jgi:uncharacterized repeat protein (TIGR03803 family)
MQPSMSGLHRLRVLTAIVLGFALVASAQSQEKVIHTFHGKDGVAPSAAPILDAVGNLYGTTYAGGSQDCVGDGCGTVYELSPKAGGGWAEKVLHVFRFNGKDGVFPSARLTMDDAGNLFGTTADGGDGCGGYGCGTVFELSPNGDGTWKATTLHSFNDADGQVVYAGVVVGSDGSIYGTTAAGGAHNAGVAFQLSPGKDDHWVETVLHDFTGGRDGGGPGQLISDQAGNLYGTTADGGAFLYGTVFELSEIAGKWSETVLYNFKQNKDSLGVSSVILDNAGGFYGTLVSQQTDGVIFQLKQVNGEWKKTIIFRFNLTNGSWPLPRLALDASGNIYGTTEFGGSHDLGVVYELSPTKSGWKQRVLHEFAGQKDGATPWDGVVLSPTGQLYGTTRMGGTKDVGVVFQVTP